LMCGNISARGPESSRTTIDYNSIKIFNEAEILLDSNILER